MAYSKYILCVSEEENPLSLLKVSHRILYIAKEYVEFIKLFTTQ